MFARSERRTRNGHGAPPDRASLLALLRSRAILRAAPGEPIVDRTGASAPWMFYSWNVSLTAEGAQLAARCLLDRLEDFGVTQLATYGSTGVPLLSACVLLGDGRYTGVCVRPAPKGGRGGRQVDGPADPSRAVVVIDDSLSSGRSLLSGIEVLEARGFRVEGAACLVEFPHRGGRERAEALGYRVESLFDIWDDIGMSRPVHVAGWRRVDVPPAAEGPLEDGLHPATLARRVAEELLRTGRVPAAPARLDGSYDGRGGAWLSFRSRRTDERLARDGFWHFDPADADPCRDVVLATVKTVRGAGLRLEQLDELKIAVTFFGPLEPIEPAGVDFSRYGLVVRSSFWPTKVGGALPNTQVFTSDREQHDLALRNAGVTAFEPHELYRHQVAKFAEPGERWLPYGAPDEPSYGWTRDPATGRALVGRARAAVLAAARGTDLPTDRLEPGAVPAELSAIAVTLHRRGVVGCSVSAREDPDDAIVAAARAAVADQRFIPDLDDADWDAVRVAVSVLHDPERLGWRTPAVAGRKLRLGRDSLSVQSGDRSALFLESVGPQYDWTAERVAERLLEKAGLPQGRAFWTTHRTATWLETSDGVVRHEFGFAEPPDVPVDATALRNDLALVGRHLAANIGPSALPCYAQAPVPGWRWEEGTGARIVHGLSGLIEAGAILARPEWQRLGRRGLEICLDAVRERPQGGAMLDLPGQRCGPMADCELLAVASDGSADARLDGLAARVEELLGPDGAIHPPGQDVRIQRDNDFLPSAVLLALAMHSGGADPQLGTRLQPYRDWQMRRFSRLRTWGQLGWLPQALAAVFRATADEGYLDGALEVADACLPRQVAATGAFLTDLSPGGPSFHTAFVAEGIADAWELALACGDDARAARYEASWWAAMGFMRRLIIRPADAPCLADPDRSVGGVRGTLTSSHLRVDYASHLAIALAKGLRLVASS